MPTYTTNYSFEQPIVGGDVNLWGGKINTVIGQIDTQIKNRANDITTVSTSVTTLSNATVKLDGSVTMTGMLRLPASTNPTLANHAVPKSYADSLVTGLAALASPAFTGTPTAPTASGGTNTTQIATTAFVTGALGSYLTSSTAASTYAPLASPALTGTPTAPTAAAGTNTTQIATTAFVAASASKPTNTTKTTAQTNTTTTYASALSLDLSAGKKYEIFARVVVNSSTTNGYKVGVSISQTPQAGSYVLVSGLPFVPSATITAVATSSAAATNITIDVRAIIVANATDGGAFAISFANNTTTAGTSTMRAGSFMTATEVA